MKKIALLLLLFVGMANAQIVNIPDANFKARLLAADITSFIASNAAGNPIKIDTNNDGEIQQSEALTVYRLRVFNSSILSLTGISSFTNLTHLECNGNILFTLDVSALTNLTNLTCSQNFLTSLNLSGMPNLTQVFCDHNQLTNINLNGSPNILQFYCSNNPLGNLDVTALPNLALLFCENANLTSLNVSGLTNLQGLFCNFNNLTSLNVSGLTSLQQLQCSRNQLSSLNVSTLTSLTSLNCYYNQLTSLDLSNNSNLVQLSCGENNIPTLNINNLTNLIFLECSYLPNNLVINGANLNALTTFQFVGPNTNLTLNGFPAMKDLNLALSQPAITLNITGFSSDSNIYLSSNTLTSLTVNGSGITNLKNLNCSHNNLTSLNLNGLNNLSGLYCGDNDLTSLNLTGLTSLKELSVAQNRISSLNLAGMTNLKHLDVNNNALTSLNLTGLSNLEYLDFSNNFQINPIGNQITSLDAASLPNLKYLDFSNYLFDGALGALGNTITSLDLSNSIHLEELKCVKNNIPTLVVNGLTDLKTLDCSHNLLTSLDLIGLTNLRNLNYADNQLSNLNMTGLVNITNLDCSGNNISTLTLSDMPNLVSLYCHTNLISTLDISSLTQLKGLYCDNNQIASLDLSATPNLEGLYCNSNQLTTLDVSNVSGLTALHCGSNHLTSLDVSILTNLMFFYCANNELTSLDVTPLVNLWTLGCDSNQLTSLDVSTQSILTELTCAYNQLTSLNLSTLPQLRSLLCNNNQITSLDVSNQQNLMVLYCQANQLTTLDLSTSSNLTDVYCGDNPLLSTLFLKNGHAEENLNFSNNPALTYICADDAQVASVQTKLNDLSMTSTVCNSYCSFSPGGPHNTVVGTTIFDGNNNGCNINDPLHPNIRVDITDGTTTGSAFTNSNGNCTFFTEAGTYSIFPNIENAAAFNISPANATITFPDNNNNISNQSFCLSPNGNHPDIEVVVSPVGPARPGFDANYKIVYKNKGNQSLSGAIDLTFEDAKLDLVSALPIADTQTGNNMSWAYSNLLPFESRSINVVFNVNSPTETPAVNNGDILNFTTSATPAAGDEVPSDNSFALAQTVVGPFDPNAKTCLEGNVLSPTQIGNYLHYNIDFENLGSADAVNVVVKDSIDTTKFDINSLQVLYSSHAMRATIRGNVVEFIFESINLAAASGNPPVGGHGNVLFKIKTLPTLVPGDQVENKADIYFDYNAPVATEAARSTFELLGNPGHHTDETVVVYPNPTKGNINIQCSGIIETVELFDIQGRLLRTAIINANTANLDMSDKSNGIYFIRITSDKGMKVEKVVRQ